MTPISHSLSSSPLVSDYTIVLNREKADPAIQESRQEIEALEDDRFRVESMLTLERNARVSSFRETFPMDFQILKEPAEDQVKVKGQMVYLGTMLCGVGAIASSLLFQTMSLGNAFAIGGASVFVGAGLSALFLKTCGNKLFPRAIDPSVVNCLEGKKEGLEYRIESARQREQQAIQKFLKGRPVEGQGAVLSVKEEPAIIIQEEEKLIDIDGLKLERQTWHGAS